MKFPSIFKTAKPMSFDIKPRYYDPVREEIEQRTERIKRNLQAEGVIKSDEELSESFMEDYGSSIKGAFTQGGQIKGRQSSPLNSAGLMRFIIFLLLISGLFGYIYYGSIVLYGLLILVISGGLYGLSLRLKRKSNR